MTSARKREGRADRRGGFLRDVGERMPPDQRAECRDAHHAPDEHRKPCGGYVDEHDLDGRALLVIVGRDERPASARTAKDRGRRRKPRQRRSASMRKRDGLARSMRLMAVLIEAGSSQAMWRRHQNQFHAIAVHALVEPWRRPAAAANGPTTRLKSDSPQRIENGVPNGDCPVAAAWKRYAEDQRRDRQRQHQHRQQQSAAPERDGQRRPDHADKRQRRGAGEQRQQHAERGCASRLSKRPRQARRRSAEARGDPVRKRLGDAAARAASGS